jgi:hypothetical protein
MMTLKDKKYMQNQQNTRKGVIFYYSDTPPFLLSPFFYRTPPPCVSHAFLLPTNQPCAVRLLRRSAVSKAVLV